MAGLTPGQAYATCLNAATSDPNGVRELSISGDKVTCDATRGGDTTPATVYAVFDDTLAVCDMEYCVGGRDADGDGGTNALYGGSGDDKLYGGSTESGQLGDDTCQGWPANPPADATCEGDQVFKPIACP